MQIWQKQNEKIDMYNFLVRDCTQKNGSPYFSSIARQLMVVSIKKEC